MKNNIWERGVNIWVFILFFSIAAKSQIINIESQRIITDTTGWSGNAGITLAASKFTKSYAAVSTNGHIQYQTSKDLWLFIVDYDLVNAGGENFNNSAFGHIRYNRKLSDLIRLEIFTQGQFNSVTKIDIRYLNGIGLRFKLSPYERAKFYYGLTYMLEYERLKDPAITNNDSRLSSYFTFTLRPEETVLFVNTTYMQPRLSDFRDYRFSNDTRLVFNVTDQLKFMTTFHFLYDSRPPEGIPTINYQVRNGLSYGF